MCFAFYKKLKRRAKGQMGLGGKWVLVLEVLLAPCRYICMVCTLVLSIQYLSSFFLVSHWVSFFKANKKMIVSFVLKGCPQWQVLLRPFLCYLFLLIVTIHLHNVFMNLELSIYSFHCKRQFHPLDMFTFLALCSVLVKWLMFLIKQN